MDDSGHEKNNEQAWDDTFKFTERLLDEGACYECLARALVCACAHIMDHYDGHGAGINFLKEAIDHLREQDAAQRTSRH